jgi:glutaredoxin
MKAAAQIALACAGFAACAAFAQQYRWVDEQGKLRYSDAPPPASAKNIQKLELRAAKPEPAPLPFDVARVQADFPVTLYTSPNCKDSCVAARDALNKRGIPFKETQVWDEASNAELKKISGANEVPTLVVGRTVQGGFEQGIYDALLDSAGYPKAGVLPPRAQKAPEAPEDYVAPGESGAPKPVAAPVGGAIPGKRGPYDASGLTSREKPRAGQYDPSSLTGPPPRAGQYGIPGQK